MEITRILKTLLVAVAAAAAVPAAAQPAPTIAPAPAWVKPIAFPSPNSKDKDKPLQILLIAAQSRYPAGAPSEHHMETATQIQNPEGLAGAGNIFIPWQPDQAELIVHKVEIIRGGKVEDVLAKGQTFTVLRRENNLEAATLDGMLTAVMQPEDLAVGDILHVSWSLRRKIGSIAFQPENTIVLVPGMRVRQAYYRDVWDKKTGMRWRAAASFGKAAVSNAGSTTEVVHDLRDVDPPAPPEGAPPRFAFNMLEISGYKNWGELSSLMAPLYATAARLAPASPLQAEIDRIAAADKDPTRRAIAALRLVQDRIRYVHYGMGEAGYVPATADQTWSRKFGDCKGKTAVLLALLAGLRIEAEPVLVSTMFGKAVGDMLPLIRAFDHVIVRATIDGRSYWLDGTRSGERSLEALTSSPFGYGLPLRAAGAALEDLPLLPPERPLHELDIAYDASDGFNLPVPVRGKGILRDAAAAAWRQILSQAGEEKVREALVEHLPIATKEVKITVLEPEGANGDFVYSFAGKTDMNWSEGGAEKRLRFQFDPSPLAWEPDFAREPGPFQDAPYLLDFPNDSAIRETVTLPRQGKGFTIEGESLDETLAGTRFTRTLSLSGQRVTAMSRIRRLVPEISAAEARAAKKRIEEIDAGGAWVVAPRGYAPAISEQKAIMQVEPVSGSDFVERGYRRMGVDRIKDALADFDRAIALLPKWSRGHANRGVALVHLGRFNEAETSLLRAKELNDGDFVVHQGLGMLRLEQDRLDEAVAAFTRSIELDPDNVFSLNRRSLAYRLQGRFKEALADSREILSFHPDDDVAAFQAVSAHIALGDADAAIAGMERINGSTAVEIVGDANAAMLETLGRSAEVKVWRAKSLAQVNAELEKTPLSPVPTERKAALLVSGGEYKTAVELSTQALSRFSGSTILLRARCFARLAGNMELAGAQEDCDSAVANDAGDTQSRLTRAILALRMGRWDAAIADCQAALMVERLMPSCTYVRGVARFEKGEKEAAERDLLRARRLDPTIDVNFRRLGLERLPASSEKAPKT